MKRNSKKVLMMGILVVIIIVVVTGVSLAFFNYTRTGSANTVRTGRIYFNHTQDGKIELTNVFPAQKNNLNSTNSDTVTINITGDTTYSEGIEYKVTLEEVNNTINNKEVPISIRATANNLGTEDSNYYTNRENKDKIYKLNSEGEAYNGKYIAVGYIPAGSTGVNGSIDITAYIDTNKVAITDTYLNDTNEDWVMGREVFTTTEWNNFTSTPLSFKIKVEANEGIWVEQEKFLTMKNIYSDSNWSAIRANITSIEFHKDGTAPANAVTSFDVTDSTSDPNKGNITLYTVDDGLGNNTYKAIVVANDIIYAPKNSNGLFFGCTNLITVNSDNFKVDNVESMYQIFMNCKNLKNINSLSHWNTSNVTTMSQMFTNCAGMENVDGLRNWNVKNVSSFMRMFRGCINIVVIDLSNWKTSSLSGIGLYEMFGMYNSDGSINLNSKLKKIILSEKFDTSNVTYMWGMFSNNTNIENYNFLQYLNTKNIVNMKQMFQNNYNLKNLQFLSSYDISNVTNFDSMFYGCLNLADSYGINDWDLNANATFTGMFSGGTPSHPEFTKFHNGTWNNGTFTPNA